jgi:hypothetical protein
MNLTTIGEIVALIFGIVALVESRGRNWVAWGLVVLCAVLVYASLK